MNIFVGNLPWKLSEDTLREKFEQHGEVTSVKIITDKESGRSKGFGFIEMSDDAEAKAAISELHESEVEGRNIVVNEARPREEHTR